MPKTFSFFGLPTGMWDLSPRSHGVDRPWRLRGSGGSTVCFSLEDPLLFLCPEESLLLLPLLLRRFVSSAAKMLLLFILLAASVSLLSSRRSEHQASQDC